MKSLKNVRLRRDPSRKNFLISLEKDTTNRTSSQLGYWSRGVLTVIGVNRILLAKALSSGAIVTNGRLRKLLSKSSTF